jgi:PIN domain nuclease of toxin-antitoxin system
MDYVIDTHALIWYFTGSPIETHLNQTKHNRVCPFEDLVILTIW